MRPSTALCLLVIACLVISISAKKKDKTPDRKNKPSNRGRPKVTVNKRPRKEETPPPSEEEEDDSDNVEDSEEESDGVEDEEDESEEEEESDSEEDSDDDVSEGDSSGNEKSYSKGVFSSEEFKAERRDQMMEKGIFYNIDSIKKYFEGPDFMGDEEVVEMFRRFNNCETLTREKMAANPHKPLQPLFVVEGVNPDTRRKVAQILAHRLKGLYIVNQPRILIGPVPKDEGAKRAYYALSKYAIANKVRISLLIKPVVIESYWTEHASYIMGKVWDKAHKLPEKGSEIYSFPEDLLLPNITFAIFNAPPPRLGRRPSAKYMLGQRMLLIYKRFTGAKVHIVRFPESPKMVADKIDLYLHGMSPRHTRQGSFEITLG